MSQVESAVHSASVVVGVAVVVGAAAVVVNDPDSGMAVTVLADATKPQDAEQLLYTAVEAQLFNMLKLRSGYKLNYQSIEDDKVDEVSGSVVGADRTEEGLTAGLGLDRHDAEVLLLGEDQCPRPPIQRNQFLVGNPPEELDARRRRPLQ